VPPYQIKSDLQPQLTTGGGYALGFTGNSPTLQPEIIRSYSAGLELNFFKNRIGAEITYFNQVNDNQILRLVRLSYALPQNLLRKTKTFTNLSVFVAGTDLYMWTNYSGADPNVNGVTPSTGGAGAGGFDYGTLAAPRVLSFGLTVGL
jgi:TonB dependent receptor